MSRRTPFTILLCVLSLALAPAIGCGGKKDGDASSASAKKKKKKGKKGKKSKKSSYEGGAVADGGTISGTVSYAGDKTDVKVKVTKDKEVCLKQATGEELPKGALVVNGGKLKNAIVVLEGIKKGKQFEPATVTVDNIDCIFEPRVSVAHVGGKIAAKNSDPVLHNTHLYLKKGADLKNLFNIALPSKDQVIEKKLKKEGVVDIRCDAHEWMQAFMYVSAHPYTALTDDNGAFSLSDVPAGDYNVKIWHEELGEKSAKATVAAGGTATVDVAF